MFICLNKVTHDTPSVSPFGLPAFNCGMIATGNHNFERFAALCNTLPGEARALRAAPTYTSDGSFSSCCWYSGKTEYMGLTFL